MEPKSPSAPQPEPCFLTRVINQDENVVTPHGQPNVEAAPLTPWPCKTPHCSSWVEPPAPGASDTAHSIRMVMKLLCSRTDHRSTLHPRMQQWQQLITCGVPMSRAKSTMLRRCSLLQLPSLPMHSLSPALPHLSNPFFVHCIALHCSSWPYRAGPSPLTHTNSCKDDPRAPQAPLV